MSQALPSTATTATATTGGPPARSRSKIKLLATRESARDSPRRKPVEPPKFYNKTYLRRYTQGEVKGPTAITAAPLLPAPATILQGTHTRKKNKEKEQRLLFAGHHRPERESSANSPTRTRASHHRERRLTYTKVGPSQKVSKDGVDPATITISPTILKLADDMNEIRDGSPTRPLVSSKPEVHVNPYNRTPGNFTGEMKPKISEQQQQQQIQQQQQQQQQDNYKYSFIHAMASVKSSYFKDAGIHESAHIPDELQSVSGEWTRHDMFKRIKNKVEEAIKHHKVFLLRGELPRLKEALEERGWIQKYESTRTRALPYTSTSTMDARSLGDVRLPDGTPNERALTFALLRHAQPDFIWDCRNDFIEWDRGIAGNVLLNRFHKPSLYTSKLGMAHVLQDAHWIHETNVADVLFPRSYNPSRELHAFVQDFRRSSAIAVLRCFVQRMKADTHRPNLPPPEDKDKEPKTFSLEWIEQALRCCDEFVISLENDDVDIESTNEMSEDDWRAFFEECDRYLYKPDGMAILPRSDLPRLEACNTAAVTVLEKLRNVDAQFDLSGEKNIWIVKPSNLCCGSGIFMTHDLRTILRKVDSKPRDYYIVQKYIERPFLVYGTKFDIRQWFLVTSTYPMTIWSFREALLRLSSKPYSCATYHEAIHICNTAVQEKYDWDRRRRRNRQGASGGSGSANASVSGSTSTAATASVLTDDTDISIRDQGWDCEKLNDYLKSQGYEGEPYYEKIYPKMTQAIVLTMLAAQDFMDRRRCSFELYGADFMVMEDMSVWLIEINTNPRMHPPSSRITQRLYGSVLDSLVKVVMDLPMNPNADTGGMELVYKQNVPDSQPYLGPCLFAFGKTMTLHDPPTKRQAEQGNPPGLPPNAYSPWAKQQYRAWTAPPLIERLREPKVVDFIACLNTMSPSVREQDNGSGTAIDN